jgi:type II secretory pathway pseudopilin PulG
MLEVLTVVVIIGVLAATASPIMISILRDRNVARMAMRVGDVYRFARTRALERQAVLVRFSLVGGPAGSPGLEIHEAVVIDAGAPAPTCAGTAWTNGSTQSKLVTSFPAAPANPAQNPPWEDAAVDFRDPAGAIKAYAEICYTSRGGAWVRYDPSDTFVALQGVPQIGVTNTRTDMRRTVFIPPSTVARLAL